MSWTGITKECIDQELRKLHEKMTELFNVDFTYFKDIIILEKTEAREFLMENIRKNLEGKGVDYSTTRCPQIQEYLSEDPARSFFENIAFYDEKSETLNINNKLLLNHPDRVIPICVHELAEKLISTLTHPPSIRTSAKKLLEKHLYSEDSFERIPLEEFLSSFKEVVFKSVFKEGCCEAIALKTLLHSGYENMVTLIENELQQGHSKWIGYLLELENSKLGGIQKTSIFFIEDEIAKIEDERELVSRILKNFLALKSVSYHLGYPLAKEIIEKHGIEGVRAAYKNPPLKAEYFIEPSKYISSLGIK